MRLVSFPEIAGSFIAIQIAGRSGGPQNRPVTPGDFAAWTGIGHKSFWICTF
jgi:hypothetical protein